MSVATTVILWIAMVFVLVMFLLMLGY